MRFEIRFYLDEETGLPHCFEKHGVTEDEVIEVLQRPAEERSGRDNTVVAIGPTLTGLVLKVVYVPDLGGDGAFVVTAFPLVGKPLQAFRRRMRKRGRR